MGKEDDEEVQHRDAVKSKMDVKRLKSNLYWLYWQYQVITMSYLMDTFEWWFFHSGVLVGFVVIAYALYTIVPDQIRLFLQLVLHLSGLRSENNIASTTT